MSNSTKINILGASHDSFVYHSKHLAGRIESIYPNVSVEFKAVLEIDYFIALKELRSKYGGGFYSHKATHCIYITTEAAHKETTVDWVGSIEGFLKLATEQYAIEDPDAGNTATFDALGRTTTSAALQATGHQIVYLDFVDNAGVRTAKSPEYGKIVIELFEDLCPKACLNFSRLCTGADRMKAYVNAPIHRVVKDGWFQCGDIVDGSGSNSVSSFPEGQYFEDESFSVDFGGEFGGIVGYSSSGPHGNGSQFFVTLGPCGWMNSTVVGFGRVVQGLDTLQRINNATLSNERPKPEIAVGSAGRQG